MLFPFSNDWKNLCNSIVGVKPNAASHHSIFDGLFKGGSRNAVMSKIAQKVVKLLISKFSRTKDEFDWTTNYLKSARLGIVGCIPDDDGDVTCRTITRHALCV